MKLKEVGEDRDQILLRHDWWRLLSTAQQAAYARYQYLWRHDNEPDWDAAAHSRVRKRWDGGKDSFGVKHSPTWNRIVAAAVSSDAQLGVWVAAHFSDIGRNLAVAQTHALPEVLPNWLHASGSLDLYQRYCEEMPKSLQRAYQTAGDTIALRLRGTQALGLSPADQLFYVLCDEAYVSATPFFRCAFAEQLGCDRAVERYLWLAALEYEAQQPLYDAALVDEPQVFTPALHAATCEIRKHWKEYT